MTVSLTGPGLKEPCTTLHSLLVWIRAFAVVTGMAVSVVICPRFQENPEVLKCGKPEKKTFSLFHFPMRESTTCVQQSKNWLQQATGLFSRREGLEGPWLCVLNSSGTIVSGCYDTCQGCIIAATRANVEAIKAVVDSTRRSCYWDNNPHWRKIASHSFQFFQADGTEIVFFECQKKHKVKNIVPILCVCFRKRKSDEGHIHHLKPRECGGKRNNQLQNLLFCLTRVV